ncbi:hypothetical protein [Nocardioides sp. SYSU D00038]|uniref:hypothetical protein n=1 Tax=Nocardioides sp. SYSU D00038 TaxID=2812554 RepID=UPI001967EEB2|nr:hypothetical protein [Nocardioides sp. SYSU D00038]
MRRTRGQATTTLARLGVAGAVVAGLLLTSPGAPAAPGHTTMPSPAPAATTPAVADGQVNGIAQVGPTVLVGGTFTRVTPPGGSTTTRNRLFAFTAATGALRTDVNPNPNDVVNDVLEGPTATTAYVAGRFTTINGTTRNRIALIDLTTGQLVSGFNPPPINGMVNSITRAGNRLIVGGNFTAAGGRPHGGLLALNATTGALDEWMALDVADRHNDSGSGAQGAVGVRDLEASPDGTKLVAIGNFKRVEGQSRDQAVVIDLLPSGAAVDADWRTRRYEPYCYNWAFDSYMRGVSIAPSGDWFVISTTGGGVRGTLCDSAARFEFGATGQAVEPTWVDLTGGDTLWAIEATENAVYVGGHQRWMNNAFGQDSAGAGAVPRPGLAALDTGSGMPLEWNPGRNPRGAAAFVIHATPSGLWVGSDTEWIGNYSYRRPRLAFFPLAGGVAAHPEGTPTLPGDVLIGRRTGNDLSSVPFTGTSAGTRTSVGTRGVDWSQVTGAFVVGQTLFSAKADGYLHRRRFTATETGPETRIDPYNDPRWADVTTGSGNTYRGRLPSFSSEQASLTGLAYAHDRIWYTLSGRNELYWRWFNADSGTVGSEVGTASAGRGWSGTGGLFVSGNRLYVVTASNGDLGSMAFGPGGPSGSLTTVGDSVDWRGRVHLVSPGSAPPVSSPISHVGSASASGNSTTPQVSVPAAVQPGDQLVLVGSYGVSTTPATPAGWTPVAQRTDSGMVSHVWTRRATAADAGAAVRTTLPAIAKYALGVAAYRGVSAGAPVGAAVSALTSGTTSHRTPAASAGAGQWALQVWSDKSSATTAWTPAAGVTTRTSVYGTGTGRVSLLLGDLGAGVPAGTVGDRLATTDATSGRGITWTITLAP